MIAAANPLRGLAADAQSVTDLVSTMDGPVVLVGHSYGGMVITNVDANAGEITGLVYVAAFAPEPGESAYALAQRFPGSTLGDALRPVPRSNGTTDLYIDREIFHEQFCADVPAPEAARMAATQRPVTLEALQAPSGRPPAVEGASPRGSWSPRRTATSRASSSTSWPTAPAPAARSSSPPPRTRRPSRTPTRPRA